MDVSCWNEISAVALGFEKILSRFLHIDHLYGAVVVLFRDRVQFGKITVENARFPFVERIAGKRIDENEIAVRRRPFHLQHNFFDVALIRRRIGDGVRRRIVHAVGDNAKIGLGVLRPLKGSVPLFRQRPIADRTALRRVGKRDVYPVNPLDLCFYLFGVTGSIRFDVQIVARGRAAVGDAVADKRHADVFSRFQLGAKRRKHGVAS